VQRCCLSSRLKAFFTSTGVRTESQPSQQSNDNITATLLAEKSLC
jgi:hypothetical protein